MGQIFLCGLSKGTFEIPLKSMDFLRRPLEFHTKYLTPTLNKSIYDKVHLKNDPDQEFVSIFKQTPDCCLLPVWHQTVA